MTKIPNPIVSVPLAFASHFLLDMVPHWNPHLNTELKKYGKITKNSTTIVIFDVVLALISGFWMAATFSTSDMHFIWILMGAFSGVLPDVVEGPYFFLHWRNNFIKKWLAFQKAIQVDTSVLPGLTTQVATVIAAIWWVASGLSR